MREGGRKRGVEQVERYRRERERGRGEKGGA